MSVRSDGLAERVLVHAAQNYNSGWGVIVEEWGLRKVSQYLADLGVMTPNQAIRTMQPIVDLSKQ